MLTELAFNESLRLNSSNDVVKVGNLTEKGWFDLIVLC